MSEAQPSVTKPKKMVSRNVAIAFGIICIILAVGLVEAVVNYTSLISERDSRISLLDSQVSDSTSTLNLDKYEIWVDSKIVSQSANNYTYWHFSAPYAGYLKVDVPYSSTWSTYVQVIWYFDGSSYNQKNGVGYSGWTTFPILPSDVEVRVGNSEGLNGATENVSITYYY